MKDRSKGARPIGNHAEQNGPNNRNQQNGPNIETPKSGTQGVRAARAQVIEETTYRLTDLFTTISGRIEILSDRVPGPWREELLAIRGVVMKGVALNRRLYQAAQECRSEIGL